MPPFLFSSAARDLLQERTKESHSSRRNGRKNRRRSRTLHLDLSFCPSFSLSCFRSEKKKRRMTRRPIIRRKKERRTGRRKRKKMRSFRWRALGGVMEEFLEREKGQEKKDATVRAPPAFRFYFHADHPSCSFFFLLFC